MAVLADTKALAAEMSCISGCSGQLEHAARPLAIVFEDVVSDDTATHF